MPNELFLVNIFCVTLSSYLFLNVFEKLSAKVFILAFSEYGLVGTFNYRTAFNFYI